MPSKATILYDALAMDGTAEAQLAASLFRRYQDAYVDAVQSQLDRLGVRQSARIPTGQERATLERMANEDAQSVADTYNAELQRKIESVLQKDVDLATARLELRQWQQERATWKNAQISRATQGKAANYANGLFIQKNKLTAARVIWHATPPIISTSHKECIRRVGQGAVSWNEAKDWTLTSPNCRHTKRVLLQEVGGIQGQVWRG